MITLGLIKELFFISLYIKKIVSVTFNIKYNLDVKVTPDGFLTIYYNGNYIWRELIEGPTSMFGVESCDAISRIIACIDSNDSSWPKYRFIQ